jgi:hypothetical protein
MRLGGPKEFQHFGAELSLPVQIVSRPPDQKSCSNRGLRLLRLARGVTGRSQIFLELGSGSPIQVDFKPSIELAHGNRTGDISARARPQDHEAPGFQNQRRCPRRCEADAQVRTVRHCRLLARPLLYAADSEGRSAWRSEGRQGGRSGTGQSAQVVRCGPSGTSLAARSFRRGGGCESHPAAGRQAVGSLELTRHVALVGEAGLGGGSRE